MEPFRVVSSHSKPLGSADYEQPGAKAVPLPPQPLAEHEEDEQATAEDLNDSLTEIEWLPGFKAEADFECLRTPQRSTSLKRSDADADELDRLSRLDARYRPPYSYAALILEALNNHPTACLTLNEIYIWIMDTFPFYRNEGKAWKNSIRHNLSLNRMFMRVSKDMLQGDAGGKSYWTIHPKYRDSNENIETRNGKRFVRNVEDDSPYRPVSISADALGLMSVPPPPELQIPAMGGAVDRLRLQHAQPARCASAPSSVLRGPSSGAAGAKSALAHPQARRRPSSSAGSGASSVVAAASAAGRTSSKGSNNARRKRNSKGERSRSSAGSAASSKASARAAQASTKSSEATSNLLSPSHPTNYFSMTGYSFQGLRPAAAFGHDHADDDAHHGDYLDSFYPPSLPMGMGSGLSPRPMATSAHARRAHDDDDAHTAEATAASLGYFLNAGGSSHFFPTPTHQPRGMVTGSDFSVSSSRLASSHSLPAVSAKEQFPGGPLAYEQFVAELQTPGRLTSSNMPSDHAGELQWSTGLTPTGTFPAMRFYAAAASSSQTAQAHAASLMHGSATEAAAAAFAQQQEANALGMPSPLHLHDGRGGNFGSGLPTPFRVLQVVEGNEQSREDIQAHAMPFQGELAANTFHGAAPSFISGFTPVKGGAGMADMGFDENGAPLSISRMLSDRSLGLAGAKPSAPAMLGKAGSGFRFTPPRATGSGALGRSMGPRPRQPAQLHWTEPH